MKRIIFASLILAAILAASAAAQISSPIAGFVRDRAGGLRPVLGVAGSFMLGDALLEGVDFSGFGKTVGFAKTASEILVLRNGVISRRLAAPGGSAFFYTGPAGEITDIYFPDTEELWRVRGSEFEKQLKASRPLSTVEFEDQEITLTNRTRLRLPERISSVEWLSDEWIVARGEMALYAIRLNGGSPVVQLPEVAQ